MVKSNIDMTLSVVVGIIWNKAGHVLVAKRRSDVHCGGLWEFPGGKIEANETPFCALQRELFEEVGLSINQAEYLFTLPHQYPDKAVRLLVHDVTDYKNEAYGKEGQEVRWVPASELVAYKFPQANSAIVATVMHYAQLRYNTQHASEN